MLVTGILNLISIELNYLMKGNSFWGEFPCRRFGLISLRRELRRTDTFDTVSALFHQDLTVCDFLFAFQ